VLGLVLMVAAAAVAGRARAGGAAPTPLLAHLSLLFVPVGVGVMTHLGLIAQHGLGMLVVLLLSTWIGWR
jgi:holin-like protein